MSDATRADNHDASNPLLAGLGCPDTHAPRLRERTIVELLGLADFHTERAKQHIASSARYLTAAMIRIGDFTPEERESIGLADLLMEVRRGQG